MSLRRRSSQFPGAALRSTSLRGASAASLGAGPQKRGAGAPSARLRRPGAVRDAVAVGSFVVVIVAARVVVFFLRIAHAAAPDADPSERMITIITIIIIFNIKIRIQII